VWVLHPNGCVYEQTAFLVWLKRSVTTRQINKHNLILKPRKRKPMILYRNLNIKRLIHNLIAHANGNKTCGMSSEATLAKWILGQIVVPRIKYSYIRSRYIVCKLLPLDYIVWQVYLVEPFVFITIPMLNNARYIFDCKEAVVYGNARWSQSLELSAWIGRKSRDANIIMLIIVIFVI